MTLLRVRLIFSGDRGGAIDRTIEFNSAEGAPTALICAGKVYLIIEETKTDALGEYLAYRAVDFQEVH